MTNRMNLQRKLDQNGYLTLNQFVDYLREYAPEGSMAYPTCRRLCESGKIRASKFGQQWRIKRAEIERWLAEGNYEPGHTKYNPNAKQFPEFKD